MNHSKRPNDSDGHSSPATAQSLLVFSIAALSLFFTMLLAGGQPWAVLSLLVLVIQAVVDRRFVVLAAIVPALVWLVLFRVTGNRELYFPYAMYLAAHVSGLLCRRSYLLGLIAGSLVVGAFLVVRYMQHATWPVLGVELGVAAVILSLTLLAFLASPRNSIAHVMITSAASLLAYAGLSV